jgi:hypothetical protein
VCGVTLGLSAPLPTAEGGDEVPGFPLGEGGECGASAVELERGNGSQRSLGADEEYDASRRRGIRRGPIVGNVVSDRKPVLISASPGRSAILMQSS